MAAAPSGESEPLFVLEPLPELSNVIDSFFETNMFVLAGGLILMAYFIIKFEDPFQKMWTAGLTFTMLNYYATDSLFYSMIFTSIFVLVFVMVWTAMRWEDVKRGLLRVREYAALDRSLTEVFSQTICQHCSLPSPNLSTTYEYLGH